jgi:endoglucanase
MNIRQLAGLCLCAALVQNAVAAEPLPWRGISLSSAEWGEKLPFPGVYGTDYVYPSVASTAYYQAQGMNLIRLGFRWERLQPLLMAGLEPAELDRLRAFVEGSTARGLHVLLNPHNYAQYRGHAIGTPEVPQAAFADFWRRLALEFKFNPRVQFGLVNEPHSLPTETWGAAAQAAIDAIRATGADNLITVPGNGYTGAWSWFESGWYGTPNATVMAGVHDPKSRMVFEVHQYFDKDGSGTAPECVSPTIGVERLKRFTVWLREHRARGLLAELGGGANPVCEQAVRGALAHLQANADVWTGWLWWAGGPRWGDYFLSLEPEASGTERPQMRWLKPFLQGH